MPVESGDPRTCLQTYEFGNSGCFEVTGEVVGAAGQSLSGARIWLRTPTSSDFAFDYPVTDGVGRFRGRGTRMTGRPPVGTILDTISVYVVAFHPPSLVRDSILTTVTVAPLGAFPQATDVRLVLAVP